MREKKIPTLSLFSGAGGLDLGFLQAGFHITACVEIEDAYCDTLRANTGSNELLGNDVAIHSEDIRVFDATKYAELGIRCVIGGPPCQTFSAAGRRSGGVIGIDDERGQLFRAYCKILDVIEPEVFIFENVYGLPGANGGGPWREIVSEFAKRGYQLDAEVLDCADYGVPQHRERIFLVGHKSDKFVFPMPTHGPDSLTGLSLVSVEEAIQDLQSDEEPYHDNLGGLYGHLLPLVPEGLNYSFFTTEMGHPEPVFAWRSKFHDLLYKVDRSEPCRTLKAQPGKFTGPFHWKNRHFTLAELKRLQTFPDEYELVGRFGRILEQIGNSVPPRLAHVIATAVKEQLLSPTKKQSYELRPVGFKSTFRQRQRLKSKKFAKVAASAIENQYKNGQRVFDFNAENHEYTLTPKDLFDRTKNADPDSSKNNEARYCVKIDEEGKDINIFFKRASNSKYVSSIQITGLKKYLPDYENCTVHAEISECEDIFHCWGAIEDALIARSRFFTLIDIYGHYANRGDTVDINGNWRLDSDSPTLRMINFFSLTRNSGCFISRDYVLNKLEISEDQFSEATNIIRAVRFDLRNNLTHPIINPDHILCTYPFPLLSPRALVKSRVKLNMADESDLLTPNIGKLVM